MQLMIILVLVYSLRLFFFTDFSHKNTEVREFSTEGEHLHIGPILDTSLISLSPHKFAGAFFHNSHKLKKGH